MKHGSPKKKWTETRMIYTWHLQRPFKDKFDRTHWWRGLPENQIKPIAALYELARRHPIVALEHLRGATVGPLHPIQCLRMIGLKSWPKLTKQDKFYWQRTAGKLKGVDCREDYEKCMSINDEARSTFLFKRAFSGKYGNKKIEEVSRLVEADMIKHPPTASEMEKAIATAAKAAYRKGDLLMAISSDLTAAEADFLMGKEYRQHHKSTQKANRRERHQEWLAAISLFECDESRPEKLKSQSQVFHRYRRILDGICFD